MQWLVCAQYIIYCRIQDGRDRENAPVIVPVGLAVGGLFPEFISDRFFHNAQVVYSEALTHGQPRVDFYQNTLVRLGILVRYDRRLSGQ